MPSRSPSPEGPSLLRVLRTTLPYPQRTEPQAGSPGAVLSCPSAASPAQGPSTAASGVGWSWLSTTPYHLRCRGGQSTLPWWCTGKQSALQIGCCRTEWSHCWALPSRADIWSHWGRCGQVPLSHTELETHPECHLWKGRGEKSGARASKTSSEKQEPAKIQCCWRKMAIEMNLAVFFQKVQCLALLTYSWFSISLISSLSVVPFLFFS